MAVGALYRLLRSHIATSGHRSTVKKRSNPQRYSDRRMLRPEMEAQCEAVMMRIKDLGLPLRVFETWRTPERQAKLFTRGYSEIKTMGPHTRGVAFDLVHWDGVWSWATGLNKQEYNKKGQRVGPPKRTVIVDSERFAIWRYLGELIRDEFPQLTWGGTFAKPGQLMGWDPYHIEMDNWRDFGLWEPPPLEPVIPA